jgi:hypothetical protein
MEMRSSAIEDVSSPLEMHIPHKNAASPAADVASPKSGICDTAGRPM